MAMPEAVGLFHRAIIQSTPVSLLDSAARSTARAKAFVSELGMNVGELPDVPVDRLLKTQRALEVRAGGELAAGHGFSPHIDGHHIPAQPGDATSAGASATVPIMIGTTRQEWNFFMPNFDPIDDRTLRARLTLSEHVDHVVDAYWATWPTASPLELWSLIVSDQMTRVPAIRMAERKLAGSVAPVFMYLLAWESPAANGHAQSCHTLCGPLTTDNCDLSPLTADYPQSRAVAAQMADAWIAFARDGDPNHPGIPEWTSYSVADRHTMIFDVESRLERDPFGEQRQIWDNLPTGEEIMVHGKIPTRSGH
ncbi:carboxylesterase family protein [Acrocarpospora pleiomorpha]